MMKVNKKNDWSESMEIWKDVVGYEGLKEKIGGG